ncbi:MAG TPA: glycosyltransferase family 4 protein [Bryobacteraceae bacterium]|nr:glycosyltransferase family 4 protein [Bryobacteraceae bacterium]
MKVLWFTNDPLPAVHYHLGRTPSGSGTWMPCLLEELKRTPGVQVEVAASSPGLRDAQYTIDGTDYFVLSQPRFQPFFWGTKRDLQKAACLVRERRPDVIHIHGTERYYGLLAARGLVSTPCVISLQGLLGSCLQGFFGALSPRDVWRSDRLSEVATRRGLMWSYWDFQTAARREREILMGVKAFMGRTDWDRSQLYSVNPGARYFHAGEILRRDFKNHAWDLLKCDRHTVIFTNAGEPRRGIEVLLDALKLLKRDFPDARLRLAGGIGNRRGYHRFFRRTIEESGASGSVDFLGYMDGGEMAAELSRAHVFATASYVENSPNSLCEAMQVGLPCVASYTGGIPSLVQHGETGLMFPMGDAPLLADSIARIFRSDELAAHLGDNARIEATSRHAPPKVASQTLAAYNEVANGAERPYAGRPEERVAVLEQSN